MLEQVDPDSWDEPGTTLTAWNGTLMIRQTERNHVAIRKLLVTLGVLHPQQKTEQHRVRRGREREKRRTGGSAGENATAATAGVATRVS